MFCHASPTLVSVHGFALVAREDGGGSSLGCSKRMSTHGGTVGGLGRAAEHRNTLIIGKMGLRVLTFALPLLVDSRMLVLEPALAWALPLVGCKRSG